MGRKSLQEFVPCAVCGKKILRSRHDRIQRNTYACSRVCSGKLCGSKNFKGGKTMREGYVMVHAPDHPDADMNGYVREHRLIMSESLGRLLARDEAVHHRNGNKTDNRIENLELMTSGRHTSQHHRGELSKNAKLTEADIRVIRAAADSGAMQKDIRERFGISKAHVSGIIHRRYWRHID